MLWERFNAKPLVTILFFNIFNKNGNFAVLMLCCAIPVPASKYISTQKQDPLYFKFRAESNKLFSQLLKTTGSENVLKVIEKCTLCVVQGLRIDKVIITKFWKVARILNLLFLRKFKKPILCFQIEVFSFCFFLCFFCVQNFSFALLAIITTTKRQGTHITKVSNINKIIYYNYTS